AATTAPAATESAATAAPTTQAGAATVDRTGWPEKFTVGFFGGDDAEKVLKDNEPMRVYLEKELGMPVEFFTGTSYSAVIEAMRAKRVDAMEVGPFSYVLAVQEAQAEALAINTSESGDVVKYNPDVPPHYYSAIITKKGSGITTLAELKGKNFAFVDPASTSGHLAPKTLLVQNNINPDTEMKTVFAGSHPTSVLAVWNGSADAGATFEGNLYTLQKEGQIEFCNFEDNKIGQKRTPEEIKARYDSCPDGSIAIVAMSDEIPSTPFAVRTDLPPSFKATVKESLLAIKDDAALVASFGQWYTDPSKELGLETLDQYYNSLRDIAKLLNLDLKELGG
ncbi:MAG: phosphate/phosphite/phosphonate ABC transporter substrate-binding protein, partial [Chloroflexales bacterium]|nr:phosphate/phosphite/phosphonate ABC transporter substrate-binding protein [Chloroflexales bacterium]